MKITFIGVGEAFSEIPNTSILIQDKTTFLFDCGYSVPPALWRYSSDPDLIDLIYISHLHADHYFGLPAIMLRMNEDGRTKDLTIAFPREFEQLIPQALEIAYGDFMRQISYKIIFKPIDEQDTVVFGEYVLTFAKTQHARGNCAIRLTKGVQSICYSGDGRMTDSSKKLYENCDLLIHDAYHEKDKDQGLPQGHESISAIIDYQKTHHIKRIACVHIGRVNDQKAIFAHQTTTLLFPQSGDSIEL